MKKIKALAIIPARGGSKGIPKKNIVNLAGKPLIGWTIEAAQKSHFIEDIFVSSDSDEILQLAENSGAKTIKRPQELALDETLTVPVLKHAIQTIEAQNQDSHYDFLILLQPTSPLRNASHIDAAFELLLSSNCSSLISVVESSHSPLKSFVIENGFLKGLINNDYPFMRRQDLPKAYSANGAIYIVDLKLFKSLGSLLTSECIPFMMDQTASIDIDTRDDLEIANRLLSAEINS